MPTTEAYVIQQGRPSDPEAAALVRKEYSFSDPTDEEVLAAPIYGCWEANMTHALKRHPVDICRLRREKEVVLGNSGVGRVLEVGASVSTVKEGDVCAVIPIGQADAFGYAVRVYGYDAPGTVGMLAKRTKLHHRQLQPLANSAHSWKSWAAFPVRYATAWD